MKMNHKIRNQTDNVQSTLDSNRITAAGGSLEALKGIRAPVGR